MAELLLELFSEEIPARMQKGAAADLARLLGEALAPLRPEGIETFYGPRRIAAVAQVTPEVPAASRAERGPRTGAPEAALAGFLRKHGATRDQLRQEGDYWVAHLASPARPAAALIADVLPGLLRRFPWPKAMRWGGTSAFAWVRPLRRILCLLDRTVVPFDLRDGDDDGHGLASGDLTEGHRFLAPGAVAVEGLKTWKSALSDRLVIVDAAARRDVIARGVAELAAAKSHTVVPDEALLDEVAGLVEWPVPLIGRIDDAFMDLPAEVMQVSMRVNQRYFAVRDAAGGAAPWFAFVANITAADGGAAIVAGNERVLRARFADARHFWDADRRVPLADRVDALRSVTFHAKLGSQYDRTQRIQSLAGNIARNVGVFGTDVLAAVDAARLAKADLTTGMVGEFPELQGVMGSYYAAHDEQSAETALAIREHYLPRGPNDPTPRSAAGQVVALADKLDTLAGFFCIGEMPSGSGDPYALRRAALGVIRIIREHGIVLPLRRHLAQAVKNHGKDMDIEPLLDFMIERLRVQLRAEGTRYDVLNAVLALDRSDEIIELLNRADKTERFIATPEGSDLLAIHRRADNIVRIETRKDGTKHGVPLPDLLKSDAERDLYQAVTRVRQDNAIPELDFTKSLSFLATLRQPGDAFFEQVRVNDTDPDIRDNRLRLLGALVDQMNRIADFSKIEG